MVEFNSIDRFDEWKAAAIAELPADAKPQKVICCGIAIIIIETMAN